jgi:hypothetical protein
MKTCSVTGCTGKYLAKGYCSKHYQHIRFYGKILERTQYDLNNYWFDGNICYMQIYDRKNNPKCIVMIDTEDYEKVKDYKWYSNNDDTILHGQSFKKCIILSRFLTNTTDPGLEVDHKNNKRLDMRKENLRPCTRSQNSANRFKHCDNSSGYKGVSWRLDRKKWTAEIMQNGTKYRLGYFNTKEEAANAYNQKANELFSVFAKLNNTKRKLKR